jgi:hypothetical protein
MIPLKTDFIKNDIRYQIINRSLTRYLAELSSRDTHTVIGFETGRIVRSEAGVGIIGGREVVFNATEHIIGNEAFGFDKHEGFYPPRLKALAEEAFQKGTETDLNKNKEE